jgi:hypothetical protein
MPYINGFGLSAVKKTQQHICRENNDLLTKLHRFYLMLEKKKKKL